MATSPMVVLLATALDTDVPVERLVRVVSILAAALQDRSMVDWCEQELKGYLGVKMDALPSYRVDIGRPMAVDRLGRHLPLVFQEPELERIVSTIPLTQSLAEIQSCASVKPEGSFRVMFEPEQLHKLRSLATGAVDVHAVLQRSGFDAVLSGVRQRVFEWASANLSATVALPVGLPLETMLGMKPTPLLRSAQG